MIEPRRWKKSQTDCIQEAVRQVSISLNLTAQTDRLLTQFMVKTGQGVLNLPLDTSSCLLAFVSRDPRFFSVRAHNYLNDFLVNVIGKINVPLP